MFKNQRQYFESEHKKQKYNQGEKHANLRPRNEAKKAQNDQLNTLQQRKTMQNIQGNFTCI